MVASWSSSRLLVLDLGNVLLRFDFAPVMATLTELSGRSVSEVEDIWLRGSHKKAFERGERSSEDFAVALSTFTEGRLSCEAASQLWSEIFTPIPEAEDFLSSLPSEIPLWLLSDTDPIHCAYIARTWRWWSRFERRLLSYERGMVKTDPGAFDELRVQRARGRQVLFVDDRADNVACARRAQVPALRLTEWSSLRPRLNAWFGGTTPPRTGLQNPE